MNNYQLYRSNAKLGGQVKWNLILDNNQQGRLRVRDFDLTPISPFVTYNYNQSVDLLRYPHQENVRSLYQKIKGQFYDSCIDPSLKTIYPILGQDRCTKDKVLDAGCSRIPYSRYKKQFQVFCPLWLEDIKNTSKLTFTLHLTTASKYSEKGMISEVNDDMVAKSVVIDMSSDNDSFTTYLQNYVTYLSGDNTIGDNVMYINLTNKNAPEYGSVTGLHVTSGNVVTRDITTFVSNLYERVRPKMEFDDLLIENFVKNELICKQLFNFNLVFSLSDMVDASTLEMLNDSEVVIYVDVKLDDIQLEKKDFLNNYDFVPNDNGWVNFDEEGQINDYKFYLPTDRSEEGKVKGKNNIYNYLQDHRYVEFQNTNKLAPDICHWSLANNNDYIFNLYPGFENVTPMFYKNATDLWETDYTKYPNTVTWCKNDVADDTNRRSFDRIWNIVIQDVVEGKNIYFTKFSGTFIEDNMYSEDVSDTFYLRSIYSLNSIDFITGILVNAGVDYTVIYNSNNEYIILTEYRFSGYYLLISNNPNYLTFKYVRNHDKTDSDIFNRIRDILKHVIEPKFIYMFSSLNPNICDVPWIQNKEVYYTKDNQTKNIIIRYDGKIKPTFTDHKYNINYQVKLTTKEEFNNNNVFTQGIKYGIIPKYPSIGYYSLEQVQTKTRTYHPGEDQWYDLSSVYCIKPEIELKISSIKHEDGTYYTIDELVRKELRSLYPTLSKQNFEYIYNLYKYESDYEYAKWDEDFTYLYTIKLTLR